MLSYLSLLFFGTLHSNGYIFPFLICLYLLFFSQLFVRHPQTTILPLHFFFLEMVLITASWPMSPSYIHSSSGTLSDLIAWIYLSLPLYNHKGFDLGHNLNGLVVFPTFFNLSLNLAIRSPWSEPQSAPSLVFGDSQSPRVLIKKIILSCHKKKKKGFYLVGLSGARNLHAKQVMVQLSWCCWSMNPIRETHIGPIGVKSEQELSCYNGDAQA